LRTDWIDYWAVDYDFKSKKELVRVKKEDGKIEEAWTGNYILRMNGSFFGLKKTVLLKLKVF
jgi:hypothetical protein